MEQLLAKLTAFSYEIFGVFLPGLVLALFICIWWTALGPCVPEWSMNSIPALTTNTAGQMVNSLNLATGLGLGIPSLIASYFFGHFLVWIGRSGLADSNLESKHVVWRALCFRIPKPEHSFDQKLQPLYELVRTRFAAANVQLDWPQFFPVAKNYLQQKAGFSLIATYQNKYTLHRSLATASALLFWGALLGIVAGLVSFCVGHATPYWLALGGLLLMSAVLVWGFSDSYLLYWKHFGNAIITETYAALYCPRNETLQSK